MKHEHVSAGETLSRRQFLVGAAAGAAALAAQSTVARAALPNDSVILRWNDVLLQAVRGSKLGPPMVARALAIAHTCMYDAWAAYDHRAVGTRLGGLLRRPPRERTLANTEQAISFAAYRAAVDLFPGGASAIFDSLMADLGYEAGDRSTDTSSPTGIGNATANAVLGFHHRDGANQLGDESGGAPGVAYADYTGYMPANEPMDLRMPFDPSTVRDPNAWQPLCYVDAAGNVVTQPFVGAQWQRVTTFAVDQGALRSSTGPARYGSSDFLRQAQELLDISAGLTDADKMIAEYWADGPRSELPPGHWSLIAQFVARRDRHGEEGRAVERDVKLFFALTNAVSDAGCCAWDNKRAFDSVRPITAIRTVFRGRLVSAWAGPYEGTKLIDGATWFPYQPKTFPTPPFPEYSSGHSNFSAAGAEILRRFTHSDRFGGSVTLPAGSSKVEPGTVPASDLTLSWSTFSDAAAQAGISRRYGGIHFEQGDLDARATGRAAAARVWDKATDFWKGG
jgi:hypothetical protein